jgi:hypothetical protein
MRLGSIPQGGDDFNDDDPCDACYEDDCEGCEHAEAVAEEYVYDPCVDECERTDCTGCLYNECDCSECLEIRGGKRAMSYAARQEELAAVAAEMAAVQATAAKAQAAEKRAEQALPGVFNIEISIELDDEEDFDLDEVEDLCDTIRQILPVTEGQESNLFWNDNATFFGQYTGSITYNDIVEALSLHKGIIRALLIDIQRVVVSTVPHIHFEWVKED